MSERDLVRANPWTVVEAAEAFDCRYFVARNDTVRLGSGEPRSYTHVKLKYYGVAVVPVDDGGRTALVGQYRYVLDRFTWEVPRGGGKIGDPPLDSAKAELSEETGYRADHWLRLFEASASPGLTSEMAPGFVAWGLHRGVPHPGVDEQLVQKWVPFSKAVDMALSGEIGDLASIALLLAIQTRLLRGELPADLTRLLQSPGRP